MSRGCNMEVLKYLCLRKQSGKLSNSFSNRKFGVKRITVAFSTDKLLNNINVQELYVFGLLLAPFPRSHCCSGPTALDFCFPGEGFSSGSASSGAFLLTGEPFFSQLIIILLLADTWEGAWRKRVYRPRCLYWPLFIKTVELHSADLRVRTE